MKEQLYAKIFKWASIVLLVVSVALLVWAFLAGFKADEGNAVELMLKWAYLMLGLALASVLLVGLILTAFNNPKSLIRILLVAVGVAVVVGVAYLLAPGQQPLAYNGPAVSAKDLALTETVINLAYILGGAAILSIVVAEIAGAFRGKKA
ncbi:MAG: hypothetical protein J5769_04725 [Bacteroidales bacterium]|nr:hypothetical protein [Bacteroidales bacterium]